MDLGGLTRLFVSIVFSLAAFGFIYAFFKEKVSAFRPMRGYAAALCLTWAIWTFYTGLALALHWSLPLLVRSGTLEAMLLFPTAGYLGASAWVTHKVVKGLEKTWI